MKTKWTAKMLATAAVCLALSFLLSYIQLLKMPTGGSLTAASMLPLMLFAWLYGVGPGLVTGVAYGFMQLLQDAYVVHWLQLLLDYPLAFMMLGLAGAFRKVGRPWALPAGVALACFGRFLCHAVSGLAFFAEYAPAADFLSVLVYTTVYNGGYMAAELVLSAVIASLSPVRGMLRRLSAM